MKKSIISRIRAAGTGLKRAAAIAVMAFVGFVAFIVIKALQNFTWWFADLGNEWILGDVATFFIIAFAVGSVWRFTYLVWWKEDPEGQA